MTYIELFNLVKLLQFDQIYEIVVGEHKNLQISKFRHEWKLFNFEIR